MTRILRARPKPSFIPDKIRRQPLFISATSGKETIRKGRVLWSIQSSVRNWGASKAGSRTSKVKVAVYKLARHEATFGQMFGSLGGKIGLFCLKPSQIIAFIDTHPEHMGLERPIYFLFTWKRQLLIVCVVTKVGGRWAYIDEFDSERVCHGENDCSVIVPKR